MLWLAQYGHSIPYQEGVKRHSHPKVYDQTVGGDTRFCLVGGFGLVETALHHPPTNEALRSTKSADAGES